MKWSTLVNGMISSAMSKLEGGEKHPAWKILEEAKGYATEWQEVVDAEERRAAAPPPVGSQVDGEVDDVPPVGHPLQKLGAHLADLLDDDKWNNVEPMLEDVWQTLRSLPLSEGPKSADNLIRAARRLCNAVADDESASRASMTARAYLIAEIHTFQAAPHQGQEGAGA